MIRTVAPLIRAQGLTKVYPSADGQELRALGPLDLEIAAGEFVCLVGPSGCGKSTLLRILAGLDAPSAGTLDLARTDDERPFNSMVFQGDSTFPWLTVHDNVEYGLRVRGVDYRERMEIVAHMLQTVGLARFAEAYPYQLSGGMRQRVALARAFANDPHVLLMDEPFGALDAQTRALLQDELLHIWEQADITPSGNGTRARKTIVFVTHAIDEALTLGDRVLVMGSAPGQIKSAVPVPFVRPRRAFELQRDPRFGELTYAIWETLRDEVNAARAAELGTPVNV
jgi:NitT/TauT family transport system ATP-binding protein